MARLVTAIGGLALVAVLLAGCGGGGGGDAQAKVEASLLTYLGSLYPEDSDFPTGAGPPHVEDKGCVKFEPDPLTLPNRVYVKGNLRLFTPKGRRRLFNPKELSFWHCAVTFGTYHPMRVLVYVDGTNVVSAMPDPVGGRVHQAPARTYTG